MSTRSFPVLWESLCSAVGLPSSAGIDKVMQAYGHAVGRGTFQRIREGVAPQVASLQKLAEAIGLDDWSKLGAPPDGGSAVTGSFDEPPSHQHPPLLQWGVIVGTKGPLPQRFRCEVPDDALWSSTTGGTPKGTPVVFLATDQAPDPGTGVVVEDRFGARYLRVYRAGVGGHWTAAARNPNYPSLDSEEHGLRIVAVAEHRMLDGQL